mgnify:CR=1 FL=1
MVAAGDAVAVRWVASGAHTGGVLAGLEPSRRRVEVSGMSFYLALPVLADPAEAEDAIPEGRGDEAVAVLAALSAFAAANEARPPARGYEAPSARRPRAPRRSPGGPARRR